MIYRYSKPELQVQLNAVISKAIQILRDSGLNDAQIDNATHGLMDAIEVATDDDTPTLEFMLVSVLMDCQDVQRQLNNDEISEARGEIKALQTELKRLTELHLTITGWRFKNNRPKGGTGRKGYKAPLTEAIEAMCREMPDCTAKGLLTEIDADAMGQECLMFNLRERGLTSVKFTSVSAEIITYEKYGKSGKPFKISSLGNKLSDAKKEISKFR